MRHTPFDDDKPRSTALKLLPKRRSQFSNDEHLQILSIFFVIYPGKVSNIDCFRIGNIGRLFKSDILALLAAIRSTLNEMGVTLA